MAKDWVQVRTALRKDPKVVRMVAFLNRHEGYLDWLCAGGSREAATVTAKSVTSRVTCHALVEVWGVVNEHGERDGDDALLSDTTVAMLDDLAELPGIGEAMALVRWAIDEVGEDGQNRVRFPRFTLYNTLPEDRVRSKAADRKRRQRERDRERDMGRDQSVTCHTKSHARTDKRREEKNQQQEHLSERAPRGSKPAAAAEIPREVVEERVRELMRTPDWLPEGKPWIDRAGAERIARACGPPEAMAFTQEDIDRVLRDARKSRGTLTNPAAFVVSRLLSLAGEETRSA